MWATEPPLKCARRVIDAILVGMAPLNSDVDVIFDFFR